MTSSSDPDAQPTSDPDSAIRAVRNRPALTDEADYLHRLWFGRRPSDGFIDAYQAAHARLATLWDAPASQHRTVQRVVERRLDALGVEAWLRTPGTRHLLSRKLLLMAYLAECDSLHREFSPPSSGLVVSLFRLGLAGLRAGARLIRGRIEIAVHGLV